MSFSLPPGRPHAAADSVLMQALICTILLCMAVQIIALPAQRTHARTLGRAHLHLGAPATLKAAVQQGHDHDQGHGHAALFRHHHHDADDRSAANKSGALSRGEASVVGQDRGGVKP